MANVETQKIQRNQSAKNSGKPSVHHKKDEGYGRYDFFSLAPLMGVLSIILTFAALGLIFFKGLNYGIDFAGGTEIQVQFPQAVDIGELRSTVEAVGSKNASVQAFGGENEFLIRTEALVGKSEKETAETQRAFVDKLKGELETKFGLQSEHGIRRVDTVGPTVGNELKRNGLLSAFYSLLVILIYVAMRFDYKYAPGAVFCLAHDAIVTLGVFALLGREVNVQIMAAILTLIGYSLNDTIITFDRIRETLPHYRDRGLKFVINRAINDTLARTILTSGTTSIAVMAMYLWGGGVISEISFTLLIGIFVGTYSSIYVAAPMVLLGEKYKEFRQRA